MRVELLTDVEDGGATVHLLVRLSTGESASGERAPVNLALVIDRSSSMRGPRIAQASSAACQLVNQLGVRDRLSIVTFDASARLIFGPAAVTTANRAELLDRLRAIETGVGTNLASGIKKGAESILSGFVRDAISRLILLTDGQPSVGITDVARLGALVEEQQIRGVNTTAMGLGDGFDDEMLSELARRGHGGFYFLAEAADIPAAFGRELAGVFAISATNTELRVISDDDVLSLELVHRLPSRPLDDGLLVEVGELVANSPRQVLFRLTRKATTTRQRCGTIAVSYRTPAGDVGDGHVVGIELPRLPLGQHAREVKVERLRIAAVVGIDAVWARRASKDIGVALAELDCVRRDLVALRELPGEQAKGLIEELLADMDEAEAAVAASGVERERARRSMRERSHITLLGQSRVGSLPTARDDDPRDESKDSRSESDDD